MKKTFCVLMFTYGLLTAPALHATPISSCAADFSSCNIYADDMFLTLPGLAISGDAVVKKGATVVDVFRILNDVVDTGGGTGIGMTAFLFAASLGNLPSPANYTVNAVTIPQGTTVVGGYIETTYDGNGTLYNIFNATTPEPGTFALLALGVALMTLRRRKNT